MTQQQLDRSKSGYCDPHRAWDWPKASDWDTALRKLFSETWVHDLESFVIAQRQSGEVFPEPKNVFRALIQTPLNRVAFVILGQDPYHDRGQAQGISFSVPSGVRHPATLRNIFQEYSSDTGNAIPASGDLTPWTQQGGLLLNTVLTVDAHKPHSHRRKGWERFTDRVISTVNQLGRPVAFVLWGKPALRKRELIDADRHFVVESPHPSPLSAHRGFFGSKPFSRINVWRASLGLTDIDWRL